MHAKSLQSCRLCATPRTVARQAPLSPGFSTQEYWSGLPFPTPGDLPDLGIKPGSLHLLHWQANLGNPEMDCCCCCCCWVAAVVSDSVRPYRRQPTRLPCPWDSPGKNTGVGCHFLLQCMQVKSEREAAQPCPTHTDTRDCSLPGSSVPGIFQARVLEWVPLKPHILISSSGFFSVALYFSILASGR